MKKVWWRIRLFVLMTWLGYTPKRRVNLITTWKFTGEECWIEFYSDGMGPLESLKEDLSYF